MTAITSLDGVGESSFVHLFPFGLGAEVELRLPITWWLGVMVTLEPKLAEAPSISLASIGVGIGPRIRGKIVEWYWAAACYPAKLGRGKEAQ